MLNSEWLSGDYYGDYFFVDHFNEYCIILKPAGMKGGFKIAK